MSDTLQISITATGAAEITKLFESVEKLTGAAGKLAGSGKSLEELSKAISLLGKGASAFDQLKNQLKTLNEIVQALPTQIAVALKGMSAVGQQSGEALGEAFAKGAKGSLQEASKTVKAEVAKLQKEYEAAVASGNRPSALELRGLQTQGVKLFPSDRELAKTVQETQGTLNQIYQYKVRLDRQAEAESSRLLKSIESDTQASYNRMYQYRMAADRKATAEQQAFQKSVLNDTQQSYNAMYRYNLTQANKAASEAAAFQKSVNADTQQSYNAIYRFNTAEAKKSAAEAASFQKGIVAETQRSYNAMYQYSVKLRNQEESEIKAFNKRVSFDTQKTWDFIYKSKVAAAEAAAARIEAIESTRASRMVARAMLDAKNVESGFAAVFSQLSTGKVVTPTVMGPLRPAASGGSNSVPKMPTDDFIKFNGVANTTNTIVRGLSSSFGLLQSSIGNMLPLLGGAGLGALLVGVAKTGAEVAHTFETIRVLGETAGTGIAQLNAEMLELARTGPFGPKEIAGAMKTLSLAGLEANDILKVTKDVLNFSVAGNTSIEKAADTLVSVATAFGMDAKGFGRVGDVIAKTAAVSKASVESIAESFKTASVINKQYGVTLEDVGTGLAALAQLNIQGTAAGVALRNMYVDLTGRTKEISGIYKKMGLDFRDAQGNMLPMLDIFQKLSDFMIKFKGKSEKDLIQKFFSERGGKPSVELLDMLREIDKSGQGFANKLEELRAKIENSYGFMAIAALQMSQTTESQFKGIKASLEADLVQAFQKAEPALQSLYASLRQTLNDPAFVENLAAMVSGFARLAEVIVENYGKIALIVGGLYLLAKAIDAVAAADARRAAAAAASTAATAGNTTVTAANTAANVANAAAVSGSTAASGAAVAGVSTLARVLGGLNILVLAGTAAWIAYEFWKTKANEGDKATKSVENSIAAIEQETERIHKRTQAIRAGYDPSAVHRMEQAEVALEKMRADSAKARIQAEEEYNKVVARNKFVKGPETGPGSAGIQSARREEADALAKLGQARINEQVLLAKGEKALRNATLAYKDEADALKDAAAERAKLANQNRKDGVFDASGGGRGNFKAQLAGEGSERRAFEQELTNLIKHHERRFALQDKAAKNEQALLEMSFRANLIEEGDYYASSLAATIRYENERMRLIAEARAQEEEKITKRQSTLKERVPGIEGLVGSTADQLAKMAPATAAAVSEYQKLSEQLKDIKDKMNSMVESLKEEAELRRDRTRITFEGQLKKETKAYEDLGRSVDAALAKEKSRLAAVKQGGGAAGANSRSEVEAKARTAAEAQFTKELAERETVLVRLQGEVAKLAEEYLNMGGSSAQGGAEMAAGLDKARTAATAASTEFDKFKTKISEVGDVASEAAGIDQFQQMTEQFDKLIERSALLGDAFTDGFGRGAKALVAMVQTFDKFGKKQDEIEQGRVKAILNAKEQEEIDGINDKAREARQTNQIEMWVSMASSAKGFFKEGSRGYQALQAIETTYRVATIAGNLAVGMSNALVGVTNQAKGDPYTAVPRMAAMAAIMAGLGFATGFFGTSSSGETASSEVRQGGAATGRVVGPNDSRAGTVLGDENARSESIQRALEDIRGIDATMLEHSSKMVASLASIDSAMSSLASLIARQAGLTTGKNMGIFEGVTGTNKGDPILDEIGLSSINDFFIKAGGPLGGFIEKLQSLWGKTTQEIVDSGLTIKGSVEDLAKGLGELQQFADVKTTSSSFFGLKKDVSTGTQFKDLEDGIQEQFGRIFQSIGTTLRESAAALGVDGEAITEAINKFVVDIPRLSLKGLKGDEIKEAISAAIGSSADEIAEKVLPAFKDFQRVGEGYFETIVRVASGVEQGIIALEKFNIVAVDYNSIIDKQGDVAAELVRESIKVAETSGSVLSGVGQIISNMTGSVSELMETYAALLDVQQAMRNVGLDATALNVSLVRAAGGLSELQSALNTYYDKYFSDEEKVAVQTSNLTAEFSKLGYSLPTSRDQLRQWIEALDENNPAQAKVLAGLLMLTPAFDTLQTSMKGVADAAAAAAAAAADLQQRLQDAIDTNIMKVLNPQQRIDYQYSTITRDALSAGLFEGASFEDLLGAMKAMPKDQILGYVKALIDSGQVSGEAAISLVNLAGSLVDVKDAAAQLEHDNSVKIIQDQLDAITKEFGDLSVLDESMTKSEQFVENRNYLKELEDGLKQLLGTVGKSVQEVLNDMLQSQKALAAFRSTLADTIDDTRIRGLKGQARVDALKARETTLYAQLQTTDDPVAVAQKLQTTILDRIRLEAELREAGATDLAEIEKEARDAQIKALQEQLSTAERLRDLAKDIAQFTGELRFSDISPKNFTDQLASAKSLFDSTLTKAKAGDETAQGQLTSNAKAYLDEARAYYASGSAYSEIFNAVTGSLDAFGSTLPTDPMVTELQKQLAELEKIAQTQDQLDETIIDTSAEEVTALTALSDALAQRYDADQEKIDKQTKLAELQIEELKLVVEGQKKELEAANLRHQVLMDELDELNLNFKRLQNNELLTTVEPPQVSLRR